MIKKTGFKKLLIGLTMISATAVAVPVIFPDVAAKTLDTVTSTFNSSDETENTSQEKADKKQTSASSKENKQVKESSEAATSATSETNQSQEATVAPEEADTVAAVETPVVEETVPQEVEPTPIATQPTLQANQLNINGTFISYANAGQGSGQAVIDGNSNMAATWGGAAVQSGSDGLNTHFIGHNPGIFNVLFSLTGGSVIQVSDSNNQVTNYTVTGITQVDDYAVSADGTDYYDQMIGTGGGERITLQTCINDSTNLIVFAQA